MRPIVTYDTKKDVEAFQEKRKQWEPNYNRTEDFLPSSGMVSPTGRTSLSKPKWKPSPTPDNQRPDEWLGSPSTKKRSWKAKGEIKVLNLDDD